MLSSLIASFKNAAIGKSFLTAVINLVQHFEADYVVDGNARNALLDDLSQTLLAMKTPVTTPASAPVSITTPTSS
jgi:hypothetical protein